MRSIGITMTPAPSPYDGMLVCHGRTAGADVDFGLFNDRDLCASVMRAAER